MSATAHERYDIITAMRSYFASLLRFVTLRPVGEAATPITGSVLMLIVCLLYWVVYDWVSAQPDPQLLLDAVPFFAWYGLALVVLAALLRARMRPAPRFDAVFALAVGAVPLPLLFATLGISYLSLRWQAIASAAILVYLLFYFACGLKGLTGAPHKLAALGGVLFVLVLVYASDALDVVPEVFAPPDVEQPVASTDSSPADEESLLFEQPGKIDHALSTFAPVADNAAHAYFLGFAGVGEEKVFAQEIDLAQQVLDARYHVGSRGLALMNDARDLDQAPLASATALAYALRGIAARMKVERDVLFLSISSHGSQEPAIAVENSDLPFNDLTDQSLKDALDASGIKWRVIIISACYAGGFIDALKDAHTIVIAAAAADRTSFGCGTDSDLTYFGEAFYRDALPGARSLREAFDKAKLAIATRERREHIDASHPQAFFGTEMEAKLLAMEPKH